MIGIFDSGLGGLSALREVRRLLPQEDIIYFGDTGRVPYGSRSRETIIKYALQDMNFLMSKNREASIESDDSPSENGARNDSSAKLDAVLVACGTVSSTAIDLLREKYPRLPIIGVVDSAARVAAAATRNGRIGIIATTATIESRSFERELRAINPELELYPVACPLFVPLVENGFISPDDEVTLLVAKRYLEPIRESGADTLILGCTHYPIISRTIAKVLPGVNIVSSSKAAAEELAARLKSMGRTGGSGRTEYYVSDEPVGFEKTASIFLETELCDRVTRIDIEKY